MLASREISPPLAPTVAAFARRPTEAEIINLDWSIVPGTRDTAGNCRTCQARPCEEHHDWCGSEPPAQPAPEPAAAAPALDPEPDPEPDTPVDLHWLKHYAEQINQRVETGELVVKLEDGRVRLFARVVQEVAL